MSNREWEVNVVQGGAHGNTIQDFIYFEGMYNPVLRFAFTNVLDETFESKWNSIPYKVPAHASVKLPHHLAVKFTKEIVDKMMQADNKGLAMAVPASRKPYEDRVLAILPSEQSTELEIIKNDFIDQVRRDAERKEGEPDAQSPAENISLDFDDLRNRTIASAPKDDLAVAAPRRGRPPKLA